jgi:uncharacterized protein (UPF0548 family)
MIVLVRLVIMVGMVALVPLGLRLLDEPFDHPDLRWSRPWSRRWSRWWIVAAVPAAGALWLPRGSLAVTLFSGYVLVAGALAVRGPVRLLRRRVLTPPDLTTQTAAQTAVQAAVLTAMVSPAVAATALLAERAGYRLFGFKLEILTLTGAHFHYAGFAAALIAALVGRLASGTVPATMATLCVPAGIGLVFLGYFVGDWVELAGAVVLTAGMWLVALLTWREVRPRTSDRVVRGLLAVSASTLAVTMVLALWWAVGEATGLRHPSLTWMAATHGVGNALGFALCGVLAWHRLAVPGFPAPPPHHDRARPTRRAPGPGGRLTYHGVGATRSGSVPDGFRPLRHRSYLGRGREVYDLAGDAVMTWRMHEAAGVVVATAAPLATPGVRMACGLGAGPLRLFVPCEVVWAVVGRHATGFAYGTLTGHPECGEEAFLVTIDADGSVWLSVTAFSRPASWYTRLAGPLVAPLQRLYARRLGISLRRLTARRSRPSLEAPSSAH